MLRDYPLLIPPGGSSNINIVADGFVCTETNLTRFDIEINDGAPVTFEQQFEYNAPPDEPVQKLRVINTDSVNPLVVSLKIWKGAFRDRRTVFNQVQGVEPVTLEELTEESFHTYARVGLPQTARMALLNPAGSGRLVFLTSLHFAAQTMSATDFPEVFAREIQAAALANVIADAKPDRLGAANGVCGFGTFDQSVPLGDTIHAFSFRESAGYDIEFKRPIIIEAGRGLAFRGTGIGVSAITARFLEKSG